MLCIGRFHNAYLEDPEGPLSAQALYLEAVLYIGLHKGLKFSSDQRAARENFERIVEDFPNSPFAKKAKDFGAPGFVPGVHEKDVVLAISKRVAAKIRDDLGLEAILTRTGDRYLTLEERTAFANTRHADLFVSIHTNASRDPRAYGIETYFLNLATDDESIRVAARENATSTKNISDLHSILNHLLKNAKINESLDIGRAGAEFLDCEHEPTGL